VVMFNFTIGGFVLLSLYITRKVIDKIA